MLHKQMFVNLATRFNFKGLLAEIQDHNIHNNLFIIVCHLEQSNGIVSFLQINIRDNARHCV